MVGKQPYRIVESLKENRSGLRISVQPGVRDAGNSDCREHRISQIVIVPIVDHILENNHTEPVTVIVKLFRLNFYMLSQSIIPQGLHRQDVLLIGFRSRRSIEAVAPVPLIKQSIKEVGFSVQAKSICSIHVLNCQRPKREI